MPTADTVQIKASLTDRHFGIHTRYTDRLHGCIRHWMIHPNTEWWQFMSVKASHLTHTVCLKVVISSYFHACMFVSSWQ